MTRDSGEATLTDRLRDLYDSTRPLARKVWRSLRRGIYRLSGLVARYPLTTVGTILGFLAGMIVQQIPLLNALTLGCGPCIGALVGGFLAWRAETKPR